MDAAQRAQLQSRVGTVLRGKWRIDALLGVGGMAAVYAATHRNGHRCAIKMLLPHHRGSPDIIRRFLKEGYVANEVGHAGAVTISDDDVTEENDYFLVMELLEGRPLDRRLREGGPGMSSEEVARVLVEVLDVLAAAHARGIVHRDIKPENIFLVADGRIKVLDFGIARVRQARTESGTQMGSLMGTPAYMPPEQARGRWDEVDARSDLWSVGATGFAAIAGRPLRSAATTNEELLQAMTEPPPPLHSIKPDAPPMLCDVIDRALTFDKASRWPDARAMQAALRAALGEEAPTLHGPPALAPADFSPTATSPPATAATESEPRATEQLLSATRSQRGEQAGDVARSRRTRGPLRVAAATFAAAALFGAVVALRMTGGPEKADGPSATPVAAGPGVSPVPASRGSAAEPSAAPSTDALAPSTADADLAQADATPAKAGVAPAPRPRGPGRKSAAGAGNDAGAAAPAPPAATPSVDPLSRRR